MCRLPPLVSRGRKSCEDWTHSGHPVQRPACQALLTKAVDDRPNGKFFYLRDRYTMLGEPI